MSQNEPPVDDTGESSESTGAIEHEAVGPPDDVPAGSVQVQLRRAPRFVPFMITGAVIGVLIALLAVLLRRLPDQETEVSARAVVGYLGSIGALLGGLAGAGLAVLLDRRSAPPAPRRR